MPLPPLRGHVEARERLARAVAARQLSQSILVHGPVGVGKERLALWLAQLVVCESPGPDGPCGSCLPCRLVDRLEHPDVHWFFPLPRPQGTSSDKLREKLEESRAAELQQRRDNPNHIPSYERAPAHFLASILTLQQLALARPAMGRRKVFVVGDAELMVPQESSPEAANAFLKLLEEPAADTLVILTSSRPGALLPTIRSRVRPLRLAPLATADVKDYLVREAEIAPDEAARIAQNSRGAIGRALRLVSRDGNPAPLEESRLRARNLMRAAMSRSAVARLAAANGQAPSGSRGEFSDDLEMLTEWLRDLLAVASGASDAVADPDARELLRRAVEQRGFQPLGVTSALDRVAEAQKLAHGNVNPQLILAQLLCGIQLDLRGPSGVVAVGD